ncbi:MAG: hypothetical protein LBC49_01165 [Bacteroidales bacterium]|jgi:hypothetical protein|nr:hypothetical protein [Bacteroidales bacterium]
MKKIYLVIFLVIIIFVVLKGQSVVHIHCVTPVQNKCIFVVDFLHLDDSLFNSIKFQKGDIQKVKIKRSHTDTVFVFMKTKLLFVLNNRLLSTRKEKRENLSIIKSKNIERVYKMDKDSAIQLYGNKNSSVLFIQTTTHDTPQN